MKMIEGKQSFPFYIAKEKTYQGYAFSYALIMIKSQDHSVF